MKFAIRLSLLFCVFVFFCFRLPGQGGLPSWDWQLPANSSQILEITAGTSLDKVNFSHKGGQTATAQDPDYRNVPLRCEDQGKARWHHAFPHFLTYSQLLVVMVNDGDMRVAEQLLTGPNAPRSANANRLNSSGSPNNLVSGTIFLDLNGDCVRDSGEYGIPNFLVRAHPDQEFTLSDSTGKYTLRLDSGSKALTVFNPAIDGSMGICHPGDSLFFLLPNQCDTLNNLDIPIVLNDTCPRMQVELSSILFRNCDSSQLYLSYSNISPNTIPSPYIELELDPILSLISATLPYTSLGGNLYRFDLPPAAPFQSANFIVNVFAACNSVVGQAVCNVAHIYPDSGCPEISPLWSGASLAVTGTCVSPGIVEFEIKNVGTAVMTAPTSFIIVEDDVLRYNGTVLLGPGQDSSYAFFSNGATWACFADQVSNHPFNSIPRAFVEGCVVNTGGLFSTGHIANHQQDELEPFHSIDCDTIRQSWNPNDKSVTPVGTHNEHRIAAEDPLEYMIRFQNVDNDTAFHVVIEDQLPEALDLSTFRMLDASHPFTIHFNPNRVVQWVFSPIALVDSFSNEPASHGFVKLACEQVPGNPPGTEIENNAKIYFNDDPAIITNSTLNTIYAEADLFLVQVDEMANQENPLLVYPNPAQSEVNFRFEQHGYPKLRLELFDLTGKRLRDVQYGRIREFTLQRAGLPNGIFLFRITSKGMPVASGKIIVQ